MKPSEPSKSGEPMAEDRCDRAQWEGDKERMHTKGFSTMAGNFLRKDMAQNLIQ